MESASKEGLPSGGNASAEIAIRITVQLLTMQDVFPVGLENHHFEGIKIK